jgi:hypothetical protein
MLVTLQILALIIVSVAMIPAVAHALELPGKMRLAKADYLVVQRIYYPGFTFAGLGEPAGLLLILLLLLFSPGGAAAFWLTLVALFGLGSMQIIYWTFVHPINRVWLQGESLSSVGPGFFAFGKSRDQNGHEAPDWTTLRNRWEYWHAVRAALAMGSFIALLIAGFQAV